MSLFHSEGSVLVDYFVELSELGRTVNTAEMKRLFHDSLTKYSANQAALTASPTGNGTEYKLGKFIIDPTYTDFIGMNFHPSYLLIFFLLKIVFRKVGSLYLNIAT